MNMSQNIKDIYPLSPMQEGMLYHWLKDKNSLAYFEQVDFKVTGNIDIELTERSLNKVIEHYDILRTIFIYEKIKTPLQVVLKKRTLNVYFEDISGMQKEEKASHIKEFRRKDKAKGFELSKDILIRLSVLKSGAEEYRLMWSFHHIIMDGWCIQNIYKDFTQIYQRLKEGLTAELRPTVPYSKYIQWLEQQDKEEGLKHWQNYLNGYELQATLPKLRKVEPANKNAYDSPLEHRFIIDGNLKDGLYKVAKENHVTLNIIFQGLWGLLLQRYNNTDDVVFGTVVTGRPSEIKGIEDMIGLFINTIPVRIRIEGPTNFPELLRRLKHNTALSKAYEYLPLADIQMHTPLKGNLFDHLMGLDHNRQSSQEENSSLHNAEFMVRSISTYEQTNYDFNFGITPGDHLMLRFLFNPLVYSLDFIKRIESDIKKLATQIVYNPTIDAQTIDIINEQEKKQLLFDFNNVTPGITTSPDLDVNKTIQKIFEKEVDMYPDNTAVVHEDLQLTYRELNKRSNQLAHLLREKGVKPDTIVGIMVERSVDMIVGILGILKAGGAYLPIDPETPRDRYIAMLNDCRASLLLSHSALTRKYSFTTLQNLWSEQVKPHLTPARTRIKDLDSIPVPDRSLVNYEKYHQRIGLAPVKHTVTIQCTRGCPYQCLYCHKIWPKKHLARSAEHIFEEISKCYEAGIRRFAFVDDIFNLKIKNSTRLFEMIIKHNMKIQFYFSNGVRGDILTEEFIDLMMEAGTVDLLMALESASPRIQKLVKKNLNLDRFRENLQYIIKNYPYVNLELNIMIGFPTETEEEALVSLEFLKEQRWIHFPNMHLLKIYPNTGMYWLALECGIPEQAIRKSVELGYHELPETLPFSKGFARKYQTKFLNEYFLLKERLLYVLPHQMKIFSMNDLVQKYDSYLPTKIKSFSDILQFCKISREELGDAQCFQDDRMAAPNFRENFRKYYPPEEKDKDAFRILFLDVSLLFSSENENELYSVVEPPLGLMYLLTYLNKKFPRRIYGKIIKSQVDFDSYEELRVLLDDFQPELICLRSLSYYKNFFHSIVSLIRQWGAKAPIFTGGPYATSEYMTILQDRNIDLVVFGEGELTLAELVEKMLANNKKLPGEEVLQEVQGIAFVKNKDKPLLESTNREILQLDRLVETIDGYPGENIESGSRSTDLCYVIYTSGSTGKPKGTLAAHYNVIRVARDTNFIDLRKNDRILQLSNYAFDGSVFDIYGALLNGAALILLKWEEVIDIAKLSNLIKVKKITVFFVTTALFNALVDLKVESLHNIRKVLFGGEKVSVRHAQKAVEFCGKDKIIHVYGPTESTVYATYYFINEINETLDTIPIGKPISNTIVAVLDNHDRLQPIGVAGELFIGGQGLSRGYLNSPELTAEKYPSYPFININGKQLYRTGDLVKWLPDGNIEFIDRKDHQIKIRGFRVELEEIESQLLKHPYIKGAAVICRNDKSGDKYICAYIVPVDTAAIEKTSDQKELREYLSLTLPDYMIPSYFINLDKIPMTPSGKINKNALPDPVLKEGEGYIAPRNELEKKLAKIWSEVLGIEKNVIGIDSNFFQMGGHSLKATILISTIHKELKVKLPLAELFEKMSIRKLAEYIDNTNVTIYQGIAHVEMKEYYPQSAAQKRLFFLDQLAHISTSYNIPRMFRVKGKVDKERFEYVMKTMIARHETLRTSFGLIGNEPIQRVHQSATFEVEEIQHKQETDIILDEFIRPFNLSKPPLLRMRLVKLPGDNYLLLFDMHHIISDGTSGKILLDEFCNLYAGEELPPLRIQYKDFSNWQNNLFKSGKIKEQEEYWLNLYSNVDNIPKLSLRTDFPRPPVFIFEGEFYIFKLNTEVSRRFKEMGAEQGATLFMNLLTAFNILLFKYTGQEDIILGSDIAGRPHADLQHIIGMFVNMLTMRNYPNGQKKYFEFLKEVKERSLQAFENQDYQFEELVDQLTLERDISRNPLFDVEFVLQNVERSTANIKELSIEPFNYKTKTSLFDISLDGYEEGDEIWFVFRYCTKLFKKGTIEAMAGHLLNILGEVSRNPETPLSDIEMISEKEKRQILFEFNNTKNDIGKDKCYPQSFEQQVEKTPSKIAIKHRNKSLSYRQLDEKSKQLSNYLHYEKNIGPNDRVGIWMDRSINFLIAILGIMKAGGAYVPIDPSLPEERIKRIIDDAEIEVVISQEKYIQGLNRVQWECKTFHTFINIDTDIKDEDNESLTENEKLELKNTQGLWNYVVETAVDEISEGGWFTSYTGESFTKEEMVEYGDNALKKLMPLLHKDMRVLEIGCASGITMYRIAPRVGAYYGTDISCVTIAKNKQRVKDKQYDNIYLECLSAHEIDKIGERGFDLVIINSVIQSFHSNNYLINVLRKAVDLMAEKAYLFIGDVLDRDLKPNLIREMIDFQQANNGKNYKTKIDWAAELFFSREFFEDLAVEIPGIKKVEFSNKIYTIENELTKFRYDTLLTIDKTVNDPDKIKRKHKYQHDLKELNRFNSQKAETPSNPDDFAYVIYTSGTTGQPKGVLIHQGGMMNHIYAKINDLSITGEDIIAQTASASFDISVWQILAGILKGASTVIIDKETVLEPKKFLKVLQREKITILESVPSLMTVFLQMIGQEEDNKLNHLRWLIPTGEALPVPLVREWYMQNPGIKLINAYGPTEASDDVTHYVVEDIPLETQMTIPIGKPLQNLHIYILDKNLSLCPVGVRGEICVAGIGVGKGYWRDNEKTKKSFIPNPFLKDIGDDSYASIYKTGDIGYFREDGNIECLGRIDFQVKIRGNRIELGEIESQLLKHTEIKEAVVTVVKGDDENETHIEEGYNSICAYYVSDKEIETTDLREYLLKELPDYMVPSYFIPMEKIPLTTSGKIDRKALPAPGAREIGDKHTAPRDEVEKRLAQIWSNLLGLEEEKIGIENNFFDLGGHSLSAIALISKIYKEFGVELPITLVFETPTIKEISEQIKLNSRIEEPMVFFNQFKQKKIFYFPPGVGFGLAYQDVSSILNDYFFCSFNFIEDENRVAEYVKIITKLQPVGPYIFSGYSAAGPIIFEVTSTLEKQGFEVSDIIFLDCFFTGKTNVMNREETEDYSNVLKKRMKNLGADFLKEKVVKKSIKYLRYEGTTTRLDVVNANVHLILSTDKKERDEIRCWDTLTTKTSLVYQGYGTHHEMLKHGPLEENAKIIKKILEKIESENRQRFAIISN